MAEAKDSGGIEMAQASSRQQDDIEDIKLAAGEIKEIQGDSHFYETITAAPLDPWSKASLQLYLILLVAALNATSSGFDGVSLTHHDMSNSLLTLRTVHLQLHQRHGPIQEILQPHRARWEHWNVSLQAQPAPLRGNLPTKICHLTPATASS